MLALEKLSKSHTTSSYILQGIRLSLLPELAIEFGVPVNYSNTTLTPQPQNQLINDAGVELLSHRFAKFNCPCAHFKLIQLWRIYSNGYFKWVNSDDFTHDIGDNEQETSGDTCYCRNSNIIIPPTTVLVQPARISERKQTFEVRVEPVQWLVEL